MSVITFVCAGQMASALTFPAFENGHEVRLVGSPLDRGIIDGLRKDNYHITFMMGLSIIRLRNLKKHWKARI